MLLVMLLVVGPDADLLLEHPDKPTNSAVAASPVAATVLARAFVIAFDSFVMGGLVPPYFGRTAVIRKRRGGGRKLGRTTGAGRPAAAVRFLATSAAGAAPNTSYGGPRSRSNGASARGAAGLVTLSRHG
ncbi:hypothetical protein MINTM003_30010 [Mycobacterium paraintracellulare]|nr:hypothetical protein MINTM003_30010 [Mycobacterium paraintracellulare]